MTTSKFPKFVIIASLIMAALIIGGYFLINHLANKKIPELLGDNVEIEKIEIDLWNSYIRFDKPAVIIDSTENKSKVRMYGEAEKITIDGFSLLDILISKKIGVKHFTVENPNFRINLPESKPTSSEKEQINLFIQGFFNRIEVDKFELVDANCLVSEMEKDTLLAVDKLNINAEKIIIDTTTIGEVFPVRFENPHVTIQRIFIQPNDIYKIMWSNLEMKDYHLSIKDFVMASNYDRQSFPKQFPYEKAMIEVKASEIMAQFSTWDFYSDTLPTIQSPKININELKLEVYKDKRRPEQPLQIKQLLSGLIKQIPINLTIDTLTLKNSYISYEQRPVVKPRTGKIFFDHVYMTGYNITNDKSHIAENKWTVLDVLSDFMGYGKFNTKFELDMASEKQAFKASGKLGEMPVTYANQVLMPLANTTAEGTIHYLNFNMSGDDFSTSGEVKMEYSDLKITIMDEQKDKKWLKTAIGNLILRNKNKKEEETDQLKTGDIYFIRYQNKDFFNLLWNGVRTGLMDILNPVYQNPDKVNPPSSTKYKTGG